MPVQPIGLPNVGALGGGGAPRPGAGVQPGRTPNLGAAMQGFRPPRGQPGIQQGPGLGRIGEGLAEAGREWGRRRERQEERQSQQDFMRRERISSQDFQAMENTKTRREAQIIAQARYLGDQQLLNQAVLTQDIAALQEMGVGYAPGSVEAAQHSRNMAILRTGYAEGSQFNPFAEGQFRGPDLYGDRASAAQTLLDDKPRRRGEALDSTRLAQPPRDEQGRIVSQAEPSVNVPLEQRAIGPGGLPLADMPLEREAELTHAIITMHQQATESAQKKAMGATALAQMDVAIRNMIRKRMETIDQQLLVLGVDPTGDGNDVVSMGVYPATLVELLEDPEWQDRRPEELIVEMMKRANQAGAEVFSGALDSIGGPAVAEGRDVGGYFNPSVPAITTLVGRLISLVSGEVDAANATTIVGLAADYKGKDTAGFQKRLGGVAQALKRLQSALGGLPSNDFSRWGRKFGALAGDPKAQQAAQAALALRWGPQETFTEGDSGQVMASVLINQMLEAPGIKDGLLEYSRLFWTNEVEAPPAEEPGPRPPTQGGVPAQGWPPQPTPPTAPVTPMTVPGFLPGQARPTTPFVRPSRPTQQTQPGLPAEDEWQKYLQSVGAARGGQ